MRCRMRTFLLIEDARLASFLTAIAFSCFPFRRCARRFLWLGMDDLEANRQGDGEAHIGRVAG